MTGLVTLGQLPGTAAQLPVSIDYTKVFALDVAARHRVQFSMPESDAVSMLKRIP